MIEILKMMTRSNNGSPERKKLGSVLVLDDRRDIIDLFKTAGRAAGYRVVGAMTNNEARKGVEEVDPGSPLVIAFIDIEIGEESGLDIYRMIRALKPELPIVIMTGGIHHKTLIPLIVEDPCLSYLAKPFTMNEVVELIRDPHTKAGDVSELLEQAILMRDNPFDRPL